MTDLIAHSHFAQRFTGASGERREPTSRQRINLQVGYLTSFAHAASNTLVHTFQCAEPHRVAIGVPARRVVFLSDETGYNLDFEAILKRCATISSVSEMAVLPQDATGLTETATGNAPLTDADILLQQSSQLDFIRTIGALFRPTMSGGTPPIFEIDEGQPLGPRLNCHRRNHPLRAAIVDGISKEALRVITEDHARQIRHLQSQVSDARQFHTSETVEFYSDRDQLKHEISRLQMELLGCQRQLREERDAAKIQLSHALEDLRKARDELTYSKLLRFQTTETPEVRYARPPAIHQEQPAEGSNALRKLRDELASNDQFISRIRSPSKQSDTGAPNFVLY